MPDKSPKKPHRLRYVEHERLRVPVDQLYPGMYVVELDRDWLDSPFLFQGFELENWDDVHAVMDCCEYVYIDTTRQREIPQPERSVQTSGFVTTTHMERQQPAEQELRQANGTYRHASRLVSTIMDDVRLGKSIDTPKAKEAVEACVDSVIRSSDALLLLTRIKNKDAYTAEHSLNVAILSIAFGRQLGFDRNRLEELGMCGMLHDVGKILTPHEVLTKEGRLSNDEFELMKQHTTHGRDVLSSSGRMVAGAIDVAHSHHEWLDGRGYPRKLYAHQTTLWTKVVAIADAFDAITSDRCYKDGRTNMDAFRILNKERGSHFDSDLVMSFIRTIGIYAPGSVVQMNTGEIGVVIESNKRESLKPKVMLVKSPDGEAIAPRLLDLSQDIPTPDARSFYKIATMRRPSEVGVDMHTLREQGFLLDAILP